MIRIERKEDCYGCTACESSCPTGSIRMIADAEGFLYPKIDLQSCINCDKCERVCPKINKTPILLRCKAVYGALNISDNEYISSSSGGIFIELCRYVIAHNGIVAGAVYDNEFKVRHVLADTIEGCRAFQGSKYTQSNVCGIFNKIRKALKTGKFLLFSGTPCQVAGLKNFLGKEYDNLITCDLICHGVPSPRLFADYIQYLKRSGDIKQLNMKSKLPGDNRTTMRVDYSNGKSIRSILKTNLWGKIYFGHYAIRHSCTECAFTSMERISDITIGDFWGVHQRLNNFPEDKAISLVLINTAKGEGLIENVKSKLQMIISNPEDASQPSLHHPTSHSPQRELFWHDYNLYGFNYITRKYCGYTVMARIKEQIKTLLKYR